MKIPELVGKFFDKGLAYIFVYTINYVSNNVTPIGARNVKPLLEIVVIVKRVPINDKFPCYVHG